MKSLIRRSIGPAMLAASLAIQAQTFAADFRFDDVSETSLGLWDGQNPVYVYNHGIIRPPDVKKEWHRSTYVHPLYGLDGEVLTDDFPKDHYHHRGLFWAWPHVKIGGKDYDLWALRGIEQRFERWIERDVRPHAATLAIENGWFVGPKRVMQERVRLVTHPADATARAIDVELTWTVGSEPVTLQGAEGKSYGGLTLRFAPRTNTVITTRLGNSPKDLPITRLPWADLSALLTGQTKPSGASIFISPTHPDFPPEWLTRHYGVLCVGWPGVQPREFKAGEVIKCNYRVWIHRGMATSDQIKTAYDAYADGSRKQ